MNSLCAISILISIPSGDVMEAIGGRGCRCLRFLAIVPYQKSAYGRILALNLIFIAPL